MGQDNDSLLELARLSFQANVRTLQAPQGPRRLIVAGANQFGSVWTRDFCFASGGLLKAGLLDVVRDTLEEICAAQRADGAFPRLLDSLNPFSRFCLGLLGLRPALRFPLRANFISEHFVSPIDSNALLAWTAQRYADAGGDAGFVAGLLPALERGMAYYDGFERDGLVSQPPFSDWKDTVAARRGAVFMTQLLRWRGLSALGRLCLLSGRSAEAEAWEKSAQAVQERCREAFWDEAGGFYRDSLEFPIFSGDSNMAAVAWGFCGEEAGERVFKALHGLGLWTPLGPRAGQRYPSSEKGWLSRLALVHGYHDDYVWLWISALALAALRRLGRRAEASELSAALARRAGEDGQIGEVYRPEDGRQARTWLYHSEAPFTWSSAMLFEVL
ncbi:MAG: hypothetical protein KGO96_04390 [Elusimicrobia bacterium]|nr:hypothetical protein [Elusimicrobiota bacterium]MDE2237475.1 hypothetical protein [Elusimicrobiota bacterium]MDE2425131.1 hypothetical protein [Elusimicrobiota bacterium]